MIHRTASAAKGLCVMVCLAGAGYFPARTSAQAPPELGCASARIRIQDVPHTDGSAAIDGTLDDDIWCDALVVTLDVETSPGENVPAPVTTYVYLIEDGSRLLVGFDARDPEPEQIRAYLRDRDTAYSDDFVGIVLDTFNDQRRAFEFFANPLGVQIDMIMDDINRNESDAWDAIWDSAGTITATGYTVEMAIPFSQLRFPRDGDRQTWGIDVIRFYPRQNRSRISMNPLERGRNCYLCQLTTVTGFENAEPGKDLEIVPSITMVSSDAFDDAGGGELVDGASSTDAGLDLSWGITADLTFNLALNPDFSQVEADVPQLDVNNQFALFYPETRPFFLEGADFFSTPINAVFTRTVADPDAAAKLTGRAGESTYGVFMAEDTVTNLLFPGPLGSSSESLNESNRAMVGRYSYGFGESSTIGALVTSRSGGQYENTVTGFDGRYRLSDRHSLQYQYLHSTTDYPTGIVDSFDQPNGRFGGDATSLAYNYQSRQWNAWLNRQVTDPNFRADLGFVSQVDVESDNAGFRRTWHGDDDNWWNQLRVGANLGSRFDRGGRKLGSYREIFGGFSGPLQSFAQMGTSRGQEFFDGRLFDVENFFIYGQVRPSRRLSFNFSVNSGDQIDFANSRLGDRLNLQPSVEWNANTHLFVRLQHTRQTLDSKEGPNIFAAELNDLRLSWQFNVRSFLRLTVQHQDVTRNRSQYTDPDVDARSFSLGRQLLYSYKINPQTVLYVGYSDNLLDSDDLAGRTRANRTYFAKFSYAWIP